MRFRVRDGECYVHDVHFLDGYLHDARMCPAAATMRGKKLVIELERDCWEFGYTQHPDCLELHVARSCLSITPVSRLRWETASPKDFGKEFWIESVYVGPCHWEAAGSSELVINAPHGRWRLCISIADEFGDIRLNDLEVPYLYSARKAERSASADGGSPRQRTSSRMARRR